MYRNGSVITLAIDKLHGEGENALKLKAGVCGMIVQLRNKHSDGNHEYVVDFGAYGQWYCQHSELTGEDSVGWDGDDGDGLQIRMEEPRQNEDGGSINFDQIFRNTREGELFRPIAEEGPEEDKMPVDPVQADIDRRVKELERESKNAH